MPTLIPTPKKFSPYLLIQEFLREQPWKLLVACIMLNRTTARQVHGIINNFFDEYPKPQMIKTVSQTELAALLRPLGFQNVKAKRIKQMTDAWLLGATNGIDSLPGIGKYAADSFKIFCSGYLILDVTDKELKNYVRWAQEEERI